MASRYRTPAAGPPATTAPTFASPSAAPRPTESTVPRLSTSSPPQFCFVRTLALYMSVARRPAAPAGTEITDHLFRPLRPDRRGFKQEPLSSAALGARVRLHLMMSGAYEGETNHSFRRGALQHAASQGATLDALHAQSQIRTGAVLKRYLDTERHGAQQVRSRTAPSPK